MTPVNGSPETSYNPGGIGYLRFKSKTGKYQEKSGTRVKGCRAEGSRKMYRDEAGHTLVSEGFSICI